MWEQWSDWSACSLSCGGGSQDRQRDCVGPFHGGLECPGNGSESQNCNTHHCPSEYQYSDGDNLGFFVSFVSSFGENPRYVTLMSLSRTISTADISKVILERYYIHVF